MITGFQLSQNSVTGNHKNVISPRPLYSFETHFLIWDVSWLIMFLFLMTTVINATSQTECLWHLFRICSRHCVRLCPNILGTESLVDGHTGWGLVSDCVMRVNFQDMSLDICCKTRTSFAIDAYSYSPDVFACYTSLRNFMFSLNGIPHPLNPGFIPALVSANDKTN